MKMNQNSSFIKKAYGYMNEFTPQTFDCGKICNSKCCKGGDGDGMLLFPGEEELFINSESFTVYYDENYENLCVRCNGYCDRNSRPLSCRIFPYFIYVNAIGDKPSVAPDIRATDFCPLLFEGYTISKKFLRNLRITAAYLCQNKEYEEYLCKITAILTDFNDL